MNLDPLIRFYDEFTPESVARFGEFYSADAYFKDPFNEVRGIDAIQRIFGHMFNQVTEPRFVVTEKMHGASHLKFNAEGKVCYHRDYWDTAEELYMKLPIMGSVLRCFRKALSA